MKVYAAILISLGLYLLAAFAVNALRTSGQFMALDQELRDLDSMGASMEEMERVERKLSDSLDRETQKNRWLLGLGLSSVSIGVGAVVVRERREKQRVRTPDQPSCSAT